MSQDMVVLEQQPRVDLSVASPGVCLRTDLPEVHLREALVSDSGQVTLET